MARFIEIAGLPAAAKNRVQKLLKATPMLESAVKPLGKAFSYVP